MMDQLGFIILNGLAQINALLCQFLNSKLCLSNLVLVEQAHGRTGAHVYAKIIWRFKDEDAKKNWAKELDL